VDVYISRYGTKELPKIASLLERHNARIKTLSLKVCEKYSTPALEDVAKAMVARVGPSIETLEITFRYPWSNEKGVSIYEKIFSDAVELPMVHTITLGCDTVCAVGVAKFLLPKCPSVKELSYPKFLIVQPATITQNISP
jgi:hypothetical protein